MAETRQLLVLAGAHPPPPRIAKLLEYLPELGWSPTLLAPRLDGDRRFVTGENPSYRLVTTPFLPTPSRILAQRPRREAAKATRDAQPATSGRSAAGQSPLAGLARVTLQWLNTPDDLVGWLPWAYVAGRRLCRQLRIEAVVATGPPFTAVLAGAMLQKRIGVPLVADLRDAWTVDPLDPVGAIGGTFRAAVGPRRVRAQQALERFCLTRAFLVILTSDTTYAAYTAAYPRLADRFLVAYNGIDECDFDVPPEHFGGFQSVYVGTLHDYQLPQLERFLEGLACARATGELSGMRMVVAGHRSSSVDTALAVRIRELGLTEVVERLPAIPHRRAMALMKGAGVIVMLAGSNRFTRLSKLSDGLATGRPLIGLAPLDSETAAHLRAHGHRVMAEPTAAEVAQALVELRRATAAGTGEFPFPFPHELHWKSTAARLVSRLERYTGRP